MTSLASRSLRIAILSQAAWFATAAHGWTVNQRLILKGIPTAPAFEEETQPESARHYHWRGRDVEARLDTEGGISFRFNEERDFGVAFPGAKPGLEPQGEGVSYPVSYYGGSSRHWHSGERWERVRYRELYPGIDLVLVTKAGQLEFVFEIRPGADARKIRIRYPGAAVQLNPNGDLIIGMGREQIQQWHAVAFQADGVVVKCRYSVGNDVTLRLGRYDSRRMLTIDPVLNFSTYIGGPGYDAINALAVDWQGNIYATGVTSSSSLAPGNTQPVRATREAWVAELNSAGTQLLYLTYLGGSGNDAGTGIAVDSSGNAYVTGTTTSMDFPTTTGAFSTQSAGTQEAFVAKIVPGGAVQYSTYLGGGSDAGFGIAVDTTGAVYVAGQTGSTAFPITAGTIQPAYEGGVSDCFISKLNAAGSSLVYSTYLGGAGLDLCSGIAIDASSDAYVTGTTYSTNFPLQSELQSNLKGTASAFVAEINPTGSALLYSTYLGGSVLDNGNAITVDSFGSAYVAGSTASPDFPTTAGAEQTVLAGQYNAFVSKLTPGGNGLTYSTLMGGSGSDSAVAITLDTSGQAVVGGFTTSPDFPIANAIQPMFQLTRDAFAAVVSADGSSLVFSSFFGGAGDNRAFAVADLPPNNLALGGMTDSSSFPTAAALQNTFSGTYDGFLLSVQYESVQPVALAFFTLTPCRIADTRATSGFSSPFGAPSLAAGAARSFPIPASSCNVPALAQAYSFNITVVPHGILDYLTAWPTGKTIPPVSTLNAPLGQVLANAALVPGGTGGAISLFAPNETDVIIDIDGYFAPPVVPPALAFYPVTPCRVVDTRSYSGSGPTGALGPPQMAALSTRSFPIPATACDLPPSAQAYSFNIAVVPPALLDYVTIWAAGQPMPVVSTLNDASGAVVANAALVPAGVSGAVDVYVPQATDLIIDTNGYFAPPGSPGALYFYPLTPCRVANTRAPAGSFTAGLGPPQMPAGSTRSFPVLSSSCGIPATARAYSLNLTVVPPGALNYISAWPTGQAMPVVSTLNDVIGTVVANAAIVPAGSNGAISVFVYDATDLIIDIDGYFAP
jgi:Beta-propeller repeat